MSINGKPSFSVQLAALISVVVLISGGCSGGGGKSEADDDVGAADTVDIGDLAGGDGAGLEVGADAAQDADAQAQQGPVLSGIAPSEGSFGTVVVITGTGWPADASGSTVEFTVSGAEPMRVPLLVDETGAFTAIVPVLAAAAAEVRVESGGKKSGALPFKVLGPLDPTPGEPGSETSEAFVQEGSVCAMADHELGIALYPFLEDAGRADLADAISTALLGLQTELDAYFSETLSGRLDAEGWALVDAIISSQSGGEAVLKLAQAEELLSHSVLGEAIYDIAKARDEIGDAIDTLSDIKLALQAAEIGSSFLSPSLSAALELAVEIIDTLIDVLEDVVIILSQGPESMVASTFEIYQRIPDRHLNQEFFKDTEEIDPACILIPLPVSVRGQIDLDNRNAPGFDEMANSELPSSLADVVSLLTELLEPPHMDVNDVDIPLALRVADGGDELIEGTWGFEGLLLKGLAPGDTYVWVYPKMPQVKDVCPPFDNDCVEFSAVALGRPVRVYDRPVASTVVPDQQYLGEIINVTGECIPRLPDPPLDVHFTPPSSSAYGDGNDKALSPSYFDYSLEVPEAISGEHWFSIEDVESNRLAFEVFDPLLDKSPASAIVGEPWGVKGRGFSHRLRFNRCNFDPISVEPWGPGYPAETSELAHRALEFTVPDFISDGMFSVTTIGELESQSEWPYEVRKLSDAVVHTPAGRSGIRPMLARDELSGDRAMAWFDTCRNGQELLVSVLPAGAATWGPPVLVSANVGGMPGAPARAGLAVAGGSIHVAWIGRDEHVHVASSTDGATWNESGFADGATTVCSSLALAGEGQALLLAWTEEAGVEGGPAFLYSANSENGGASWSAKKKLSSFTADAAEPSVAMKEGVSAVAWSEAPPNPGAARTRTIRVATSLDGGKTFGQNADVYTDGIGAGRVARYPSVAVRSKCSSRVLVAWEQGNDIWLAGLSTTGVLIAPYNVSASAVVSQGVSLGIDADCIPAMAWVEAGFDESKNCPGGDRAASLWLARSFDQGASFQKTRTGEHMAIASGPQVRFSHPTLVAGGRAMLTVAWQDDAWGWPRIVSASTEGAPAIPEFYPVCQVPLEELRLILRAFSATPAGQPDLWVSDYDGKRLRRLTRSGADLGRPSVSPDALHLAYARDGVLFISEPDGRNALATVGQCDMFHVNAWFSPSGKRVAFQANTYPGTTDLNGAVSCWWCNYLGFFGMAPWPPFGDPNPIKWGADSSWISYSADRSKVVFIRGDTRWDEVMKPVEKLSSWPYGELMIMNSDSSNLRTLAGSDSAACQPAFTKDGKWVVFISKNGGGDLYRISPNAGGEQAAAPVKIHSGDGMDSWPEALDEPGKVAILAAQAGGGAMLQILNVETGGIGSNLTPADGLAGPASAFFFPGCADEEFCACTNGQKDNAETGVDCGGGVCAKCMGGSYCIANSDCASGVCLGKACVGCDDDVQNGDETDIDCGGDCIPCVSGKKCKTDGDCAGGICAADGKCAAPGVCGDNELGPGEDCEDGVKGCEKGKECKACKCEYMDVGLVWKSIPAGTFEMGCSPGDLYCLPNENPPHTVHVPAFEMTEAEITQDQFYAVIWKKPSGFKYCGGNCPVENVIYLDAFDFCKAVGGRMPSEAEFEYALRAGSTGSCVCGNNDLSCLGGISWNAYNAENKTQPVKTKAANAFGLYDMVGNVWEWVADCTHDNYNQAPTDGSAWNYECNHPVGGDSVYAVRRGAGYLSSIEAYELRASGPRLAGANGPFNFFKSKDTGFRCARTPQN